MATAPQNTPARAVFESDPESTSQILIPEDNDGGDHPTPLLDDLAHPPRLYAEQHLG
jgi:hypothetical protein